jgi:hypothetical protein
MGFLNLFTTASKPELKRFPSGAFTVDSHARILSSTVPHSVPEGLVKEIAREILAVFKNAPAANVEFSELVVQYAAFKITARAMRGGAMIFLSPSVVQAASPS